MEITHFVTNHRGYHDHFFVSSTKSPYAVPTRENGTCACVTRDTAFQQLEEKRLLVSSAWALVMMILGGRIRSKLGAAEAT